MTNRPAAPPVPLFVRRFSNRSLREKDIARIDENTWKREGEREALRLTRLAAERVPAYRAHLKKHGGSSKIRTMADFKKLPTLDKDTYLRAYPMEQLCWDGAFNGRSWTIYSTSGSTGEPFYFPHTREQDEQYALTAELYLRSNFAIHKQSTLYVNAFPLGAWIGGVFTLKAITRVAERGRYPLTVVNPGIHKEEVLKAIRKFGSSFEQIIIGSYGPFLKDLLDDGVREGMDWKQYKLGFVFAAEGFSESFRDHILDTAGQKNALTTTVNQYGTVDLGTMAFETPLAILIRRMAQSDKHLYARLFEDPLKVPTFSQYIPQLFYFEEVEGSLLCSAWSGIPLVRYDLKDNGGVHTFGEVEAILRDCGVNLAAEARKAGIPVWKMPFVYVRERRDFSVSFYAFQLHPATIRRALEVQWIRPVATGKFTMIKKHSRSHDPYLEVNIELKARVRPSPSLKRRLQKTLTEQLLQESSEYCETWKHKGSRIRPRVVCWPYGHPRFFKAGTKQKWTKR